MALSQDVITDVFRHLRYDVIGLWQSSPSGGSLSSSTLGLRYFKTYGQLLFRIQNLRPNEEAKINGVATAAIAFTGLAPAIGNTVTATLTSSALPSPGYITATVTCAALQPGQPQWSLLNVASTLANQFFLQPAFSAAGFFAIADYGSGPYSQNTVPVPVCSINAGSGVTFSLSVTSTGQLSAFINGNGQQVAPFISFKTGGAVNTVNGFVPICNFLEGAYGGATANLSVSQANTTILRADELEQREQLYDAWCDKMSKFIGVPMNPDAVLLTRMSNGGCVY